MKASISQDRKPQRHITGLSAPPPAAAGCSAAGLSGGDGDITSLAPRRAGQCAAGSDSPGCPASRSSLCPSAMASGPVDGGGEEEGQRQQCGGKQLAARCWRQ